MVSDEDYVRKGWIDKFIHRMHRWMPAIAILGLALAAYTAYLTWLGYNNKELSISYLVDSPLIVDFDKESQLKVVYDNKSVSAPRLMSLKFYNSGEVPIQKKDIESPLRLMFKKARLIEARISRTVPEGIDSSVLIEDKSLIVSHGLLNPKEAIFVELVYDGEQEVPTAGFRIAGISKPIISSDIREDIAKTAKDSKKMFGLALFSVLIATFFAFIGSFAMIFEHNDQSQYVKAENDRLKEFDASQVVIDPRKLSKESCLALLLSQSTITLSNWFNIEGFLNDIWSPEIQEKVGMSQSKFVDLLKEDMARVVPAVVSEYLVPSLDSGFDFHYREQLKGIWSKQDNLGELIESSKRATDAALDYSEPSMPQAIPGILLGAIAIGLAYTSWIMWSL